jgi:hypothetical protein
MGTMGKEKIIQTLGLVTGGGFSITDIQMVQWGRQLVFECVYRVVSKNTTPDEPVYFNLVFADCREIKYRVYAHISLEAEGHITDVADIAEINLGNGNHRRDANILTNHFGVTLSYGQLYAEMNDKRFTFA